MTQHTPNGTEGQDRESYTDDQDRDNYVPTCLSAEEIIAQLRQDKADLLGMCEAMLEDLQNGNLVSGDSGGETAGLAIENINAVIAKATKRDK